MKKTTKLSHSEFTALFNAQITAKNASKNINTTLKKEADKLKNEVKKAIVIPEGMTGKQLARIKAKEVKEVQELETAQRIHKTTIKKWKDIFFQ